MTSARLNRFFAAGDEAEAVVAFQELYGETVQRVTSIALKYCQDQSLADDAVSRIYMKVWLEWEKVVNGSKKYGELPISWLYTVARNESIKTREEYRNKRTVNADLPDIENIASVRKDGNSEHWRILEALQQIADQLPSEERLILSTFLETSSGRQLAEALGIPESSLRSKLKPFFEHLRKLLALRGLSLSITLAVLTVPRSSSANSITESSSHSGNSSRDTVITGVKALTVMVVISGLTFLLLSNIGTDREGGKTTAPRSLYNRLKVIPASFLDLALSANGAKAKANSEGTLDGVIQYATNAIDGKSTTRWEGTEPLGQLDVELDGLYEISRVEVEVCRFTQTIDILVSPDAKNWHKVQSSYRNRDVFADGQECIELVTASFKARPTRYIRIDVWDSDAVAQESTCTSIAEVRAFVLPNLAQQAGVKVVASSEVENQKYGGLASCAVDGDMNTCWNPAVSGDWLRFEFPHDVRFTTVEMHASAIKAHFDVEVSQNGLDWERVTTLKFSTATDIERLSATTSAVSAKFIRINVLRSFKSDSDEIATAVNEIRLLNTPDYALADLGATVTASSWCSYNGVDHFPETVIDGSSATVWCSPEIPSWILVELPEIQELCRIEVDVTHATQIIDIEISSDGEYWEFLLKDHMTRNEIEDSMVSSEGTEPVTTTFKRRPVKYIRITVNYSDSYVTHLFKAVIQDVRAY
ncbi:MAG: sigma-70 family RNA polymerase sigma factor [Planctomycetota bacterium]|nr:sigma-70 family RNA polymerase sigma factor [Planctomycetota bacterium]